MSSEWMVTAKTSSRTLYTILVTLIMEDKLKLGIGRDKNSYQRAESQFYERGLKDWACVTSKMKNERRSDCSP